MACETYEELLQAFFDQSLSKDEQRLLRSHLDQCSECRLDFIMYKNVFEALDELPEEQAPDISGEVLRVVEAEPLRPPSAILRLVQPAVPRTRHAWALALAATVLAVVGSFWGGSFDGAGGAPLPRPLLTAALDMGAPAVVPGESPVAAAPAAESLTLVVDGRDVTVLRHGTQTWQRVDGDVALAFGDAVRTGAESRALLAYRDSGHLKVLPGTEMQVLAQGVRVKHGATWIKIFKRGTRFVAETPNAVASVRGTVYAVEYDPEALSTRVNLFNSHAPGGGVEVTTEHGSVVLADGQYVDVVLDELTRPAPIPLDTYLAYNQLPPEQVVLGTDAPPADVAPATAADAFAAPAAPATAAPASDAAGPVVQDGVSDAAADAPVRTEPVRRPAGVPVDKGEFFDGVKNR